MKKSNYALLMVATSIIVLTACNKPVDMTVDSSAIETTTMATESLADETTVTVSETIEETEPTIPADIFSGDLVTHTVGVISIDLPEYYSVEEFSQMVQGTDVKMLYFSDPEQIQNMSIGYYDTGEDNSETYDIELGLQGSIDNMVASAKSDVGFARIQSETETQQVEFAGRTWGHRNAVVSAGREKFNADVYVTAEMKQGFVSVLLINMDGTNEDIIDRLDSIISINEQ